MASSVNPDEVASQARQRLEADVETRVAAVRQIADAARDADKKDQVARAAVAAHSAARTAAVSAGWSDKELRQIGLRPPVGGGSAPTRRRSRQQAEASPEG